MKKCFLLLAVLLPSVLFSQYKPPTGPAFDAMVKEYVASFKTGDTEGIKAKLPAMEKAWPDHPYTLFFQAFYNHASGKDIQAAMKGYSEAIRMMPEFSDPYIRRAGLFADRGMYERAVADLDKAIAAEGKDVYASLYSDRGDYKYAAGDTKGGFDDMVQAIALSPAEPRYYRGAMNLAFAMGNPAAAQDLFTRAVNGSQSGNAAVRMEHAAFLLRRQQFAEADVQSQKAIATSGFQPDAKQYNNAGIIAYRLKDYTRAASLLEKGIALDPADADMICNRASVAIDKQEWEEVYKYAQKAIAANPDNAQANMMMAIGVKRTGRGDALAATYEARAKKLEADRQK